MENKGYSQVRKLQKPYSRLISTYTQRTFYLYRYCQEHKKRIEFENVRLEVSLSDEINQNVSLNIVQDKFEGISEQQKVNRSSTLLN
jgi:hypothetical protein